ncbi:hypothetical protein GGR56DRAFT_229279 [Xylariaceae sp. FL0804]|nr:hypothetical protein GGR56DRAFT_229279 [Xylariaceae sp. FL0804]
MGRKPAPQPLALPDLHEQHHQDHHHGNQHSAPSSAHPPSTSSSLSLTSPESIVSSAPAAAPVRSVPRSAFGFQQPTLHIAPPASPRPPSSSRPSSSPRSPFVKFTPSRRTVDLHQPPPPPPLPHPASDGHSLPRQHRYAQPDSAPSTPVTSPISLSATTPVVSEPSPRLTDEKRAKSTSRFFNFVKSPRPAHHLLHSSNESSSEAMSHGAEHPAMSERVPSKASKHSDQSSIEHSSQRPAPSRSDVSLPSPSEQDINSRKGSKQKPFALLSRNRSIKDKDGLRSPKENLTLKLTEQERLAAMNGPAPLKTAPIHVDGRERAFRHMMDSSARNHSADRAHRRDTSANKDPRHDKDHRAHPPREMDRSGSSFLGGLKSSGSRAADMISKGLFGKGGRSGSTSEGHFVVDDEHYQLKVINLPLVEQTRKTRISKRLEDSRDKTEFWMPAFPWRAIDYLNFNGTEVEGLYRVPGSGPQIKKWQRKFDEEHDVDLFAQDDLYDINIIGSMLKAWLRELPDELFPKEAQERISRECAGAEEVPQLLIDELSSLSPFNYYLLFAITCHLSLLLAHSDKNKMDFRNLCICFQPCMKIDAFCFKFLVCDWRLCWQGCKTEAKYIEDEYRLFHQPLPRGLSSDSRSLSLSLSHQVDRAGSVDERNVSSSDSGIQQGPISEPQQKLRKKPLPSGHSNGNVNHLTVGSQHEARRPSGSDLRPLSPIKPLSPMGF